MALVRFFINQRLFINLLSVFLIFLGFISLKNLNRERFPIVDLDLVVISGIYPGASPAEMESLVTTPIEDALKQADGIQELESFSIDDRAGIIASLDPDHPDRRAVIEEIRRAVDAIRDFPADMERPIVTEITSRKRPIGSVVVSLRGKGEYRDLRKTARVLADQIKELKGIAEVRRNGYLNREFRAELNPAKLRYYNIGVDQVLAAVTARNTNLPVGKVLQNGKELILKTPGKITTVQELREIVVRANEEGHVVRLRQLARVQDDFEKPLTLTRVNGKPAITLTVLKKSSFDTIRVAEQLQKRIDEFRARDGRDVKYAFTIIDNAASRIQTRIGVLSSNALIGIVLVLISLFFFLNWRIALITAVGIPLAFALTFIFMDVLNYNLDLLTMLGLIVVVGMIVDDAIIVAENIYRHMEDGLSPYEAAVKGTSEVIMPVAATILTSIAAFSPMLMMSGTRGKFAFFVAIIVILALASSWLESMLALPAHVADFAKPAGDKPNRFRRRIDESFARLREGYARMLANALRFKWSVLAVVLVCIVVSLVLMFTRRVKFVPFPRDGIELFMMACKAPQGTTLEETTVRMEKLEKLLVKTVPGTRDKKNPEPHEELLSYRTLVGIIQDRPGSRWTRFGSHYGLIFANLTAHSGRARDGTVIVKDVEEKLGPEFTKLGLDCQVVKSLSGAAQKDTVDVELIGDDPAVLERIKKDVYALLDKPGKKYKIKDDSESSKDILRISASQRLLAVLGLDNRVLNSTLRTAYEGAYAANLRLDGEEVRVKLIFPESKRNRLDSLREIYLTNRRGALVPLSRITRVKRDRTASIIIHKNWKQTLTVAVDPVEKDADPAGLVSDIRAPLEKLVREKYAGYKIQFGGVFKETAETRDELLRTFNIALVFILLILITQFKSILQPMIVMAAIPLGFVGMIATLLAHGKPMSFMGTIGFIGLVGVAVNDSLVMVEFINKSISEPWARFTERFRAAQGRDELKALRAEWHTACTAAIIAGARIRFRPVLLTTVTTFFGLIPTAYGIGGDDPYIKPLAIVFAWGLLFATINSLIVIPVIYMAYLPLRLRISMLWDAILRRLGFRGTESA